MLIKLMLLINRAGIYLKGESYYRHLELVAAAKNAGNKELIVKVFEYLKN